MIVVKLHYSLCLVGNKVIVNSLRSFKQSYNLLLVNLDRS